jgi:recombinational DNA repair protein RecT
LFQVTTAIYGTFAAMMRSKQSHALWYFAALRLLNGRTQSQNWLPKRQQYSMKSKRTKADNNVWAYNFDLLS